MQKTPPLTTPYSAPSWPLLKRLFKEYLPPHMRKLGVVFIAMLVVAITTALTMYYIQPLFDRGLINQHVGVINTVVAALVGLTMFKGVAYYFQGYYMEYIGVRMIADLQQDLYKKLLVQDLAFFQNNPSATLTSRFISDLYRLKSCITQIFSAGLRDSALIIGLLANMIYQNWQLTILTVVILPPTAIIIAKTGRLMRKYARINQESTGILAHLLSQTLVHIRQVQSFTMEKSEQKRINKAVDVVFDSSAKAGQIRAFSSPLIEMVGTVVLGGMMVYAGYLIKIDELTPGAFASFIASLVAIIRPIRGLSSLNNILQEGLAAAQRTFAIMDAPRLVKNTSKTPLNVSQGEIIFNAVTLTYPDGTKALDNVSFTIKPGQTVALVGASGAGKSTALNILPRFYDATDGDVTIDGQNITQVNLNSLRQNIALVSQDVAIFDRTVSENIAYGLDKATDKQIQKAAKMASADAFIKTLPEGYNTILGENGVKLSGGQKQRIAIARAILKNAPILLLDEATSSLDTTSEHAIQTALETLTKGRTTLVIAHRLSTIVKADKIIVLKNGGITERGTHKTLLAKNGAYAKLWNLQREGGV